MRCGVSIGSLFTGYGGLDVAVQQVLGGEVRWHAEYEPPSKAHPNPSQAAARLLAHRYPGTPNLGDVSSIDWAQVEPVDVITGGFPCTDLSLAGLGLGLRTGNRSGMWNHMAAAVDVLRPNLVVIENVRGLLSAAADSALEPCPWCMGDGSVSGLRALGAVLGDLAGIGYDARWCGLRAADVGAPHGRFRVFIVAYPSSDGRDEGRPEPARIVGGPDAAVGRGGTATDTDGDAVREQPVTECWRCGAPQPGHVGVVGGVAADPGGERLEGAEHERFGKRIGQLAQHEDDSVVADPDGVGSVRGGGTRGGRGGPADHGRAVADGVAFDEDAAWERNLQFLAGQRAALAADAGGDGREGHPQRHLGSEGRQSAPCGGDPSGRVLDWGAYAPAIRRWEHTLGRVAPAPTQLSTRGGTQLSPRFVEWMQGLPEGWVTDVHGVSRNDQLRMLGNGVVPQQAVAALRFLLASAELAVAS